LADEEALEKKKPNDNSRAMGALRPLVGGLNNFKQMIKVQKKHEKQAIEKIQRRAKQIDTENKQWIQKISSPAHSQ
jgi:hypothetical protein